MTEKKLIYCSIGDRCYETNPCQHVCTLTYEDGRTEERTMLAQDIIQNRYWELLSLDDKEHLQYLSGRPYVWGIGEEKFKPAAEYTSFFEEVLSDLHKRKLQSQKNTQATQKKAKLEPAKAKLSQA